MLRLHPALFLLVLPGVAACGGKSSECEFGDPSLPIELEIVRRADSAESIVVNDGDEVPLVQPPQGGKVMFIGARARNLRGCSPNISVSLRDECTQRIVALEQRPVQMLESADGWAEPADPVQISDYSNLPACPSAAAERDVEGEPYTLRVRITDVDGRTATKDIVVTPVCADAASQAQCKCECDGAYVLGQACEPEVDGGPPPGTCPTPDAGP